MEVALPVASLVSALVAIVLRRGPVRPTRTVERGTLLLRGSQLVAVGVERGELVLDLFGGVGRWQGWSADGLTDEGNVVGTAMLTFRASVALTMEPEVIHRLEAWCRAATPLNVTVDVDGDTPLRPPSRVLLSDGFRSVAVVAGDR